MTDDTNDSAADAYQRSQERVAEILARGRAAAQEDPSELGRLAADAEMMAHLMEGGSAQGRPWGSLMQSDAFRNHFGVNPGRSETSTDSLGL